MGASADLILHNAKVITLDPKQPRAELIAIKDGKILGVGKKDALELFKGTRTKLLNCQGKTIVPGFNDAHCHPLAYAASLLSVDCGPSSVRSIAELRARIRTRAEQTPQGDWIRAAHYNEFYLGRHPARWDLDEAAPYHPVKLSHHSGHACVLNSLALQMMGISRETPEPPGGLIDRDLETGEPNGLLLEMNPWVEKAMPPLSEEELEKGVRLANKQYLSCGITSLQDATWTDSVERWQIFHQLKERGKLASRVSMMIGYDELQQSRERGLASDEQVRLGAVKIVLDETTGSLNPPEEELNRQVLEAHKAGFQIALHAIEENVLRAAIASLENALHHFSRANHRHRIEHCSVCPPPLLQRLKGAQIAVVTQPPFLYYSGERYLATVSKKDLKWLYPIGSFLSYGLETAASSDSPVVPHNPVIGIYAAVTRTTEQGQTLSPQECISALEALKMYTLKGAYVAFEEETKGSLAPGKVADLVVLSDDLTQVPPQGIKEIQVLMTLIGGRVMWEKP